MGSQFKLLVLAAALLAIAGCEKEDRANASSAGKSAAAAPVVVATVEQRDVPVEIRAIATVEAFTTVAVRSRVAGELQKVHIAPGQDVKNGDLLFEIDPRPYQAALHEAQANLEKDAATAKNAQIDADRMAGLLRDNVATREEADKAHFSAEAAQATVRADQAAVETAKLQVEYTTIRSTVDGRAGQIITQQGNVIKADDTALLTINQLRPIYVTFAIPEQDLEQVRKFNQPAQLDVDVIIPPDEERSESGKLSFIDNQVAVDTGTIRLKATFANADHRLWPGQFVQAVLKLAVEPNMAVIPTRAVQNGQQGLFAFVVKDDMTVEMRPVKIRRERGDESIVESGLKPGERIVTEGQLRLVPGAKISIKSATTAPASPTTQTNIVAGIKAEAPAAQ